MAADSIDIAEPGSPTAALATQSHLRSAATVHREEVIITGAGVDAAIATVQATDPAGSEQALVVRNIPSGTQPVSGTVTVQSLDLDIRNLGSSDVPDLMDRAARDLGKVDIASLDQYTPVGGRLPVDGSGVTQPVSGTVTANVSDNATRDNGKVDVASLDQYTPVSGRLPVDGSGVTQPVSGNVGLTPQTSGGLTTFHLVSAATTNATNIKSAAGQVFGWYIYNSNAAARKVAFHNSASAPTAGASVFFSVVIPANSGANVEFTNGIAFSAGIGITTVTGLADSDSAAVALNDLVINIFYK